MTMESTWWPAFFGAVRRIALLGSGVGTAARLVPPQQFTLTVWADDDYPRGDSGTHAELYAQGREGTLPAFQTSGGVIVGRGVPTTVYLNHDRQVLPPQ